MTRLLLAGGGHAHIEVLRRFAQRPLHGIEVVVVTPAARLLYSGMVPGVIAGAYAIDDAAIDVAGLARAAGARFVQDALIALDAERRQATLASGATIGFDLASLDVGAMTALPKGGAEAHAVPVRPLAGLLHAWDRLRTDVARSAVRAVAVVGGGAAGVELALAMTDRLRADAGDGACTVTLVTDQPEVAAQHPPAVRRRLARCLAAHGIAVVAGSAARAIDATGIELADGRRVTAERVIVATPAAAAPWLAASGLACDDAGFVRVDAYLRSVSHPAVFAAAIARRRSTRRARAPVSTPCAQVPRSPPTFAARSSDGRSSRIARSGRRSRSSRRVAATQSRRARRGRPRAPGCGGGRIASTAVSSHDIVAHPERSHVQIGPGAVPESK